MTLNVALQIINKPVMPMRRQPRRISGSTRRIGCFAVSIIVLFVLWVTGALASMGLAPNAALEGAFEGIAKPGPVTGCWQSTSKDNVLVKLEVEEATDQVTGKLTMTALTQVGFAEANVTGTRTDNNLDLRLTATDLDTTGTFDRWK
jgi:hypothetical protein